MRGGSRSARRGEDTLRQLPVRTVDHLAVEREHAGVRVGGEGGIYPLGPAHLIGRRCECRVGDIDLRRMDQDFAGKAIGGGRLQSFSDCEGNMMQILERV